MQSDTEVWGKYITYIKSQSDIVAYRAAKDLGGNGYFMVVVGTKNFKGEIIYYLDSVYHLYGTEFCRDLRGFSSYRTKELAIEAIERICGSSNLIIIK